jgi:hypothetical protein
MKIALLPTQALPVAGATLPGIASEAGIPEIGGAGIGALATEAAASFETTTPPAVLVFESGVRPLPLFRQPVATSPAQHLGVNVRDAMTQGAFGIFGLGLADPFGYGDLESASTYSNAGILSLCVLVALIGIPLLYHLLSSGGAVRHTAEEVPPETAFASTPPGAMEPEATDEGGDIAKADLSARDRAAVRIAGEKYRSVPPQKGPGHDYGKGGLH